jgi:heme oxygenase
MLADTLRVDRISAGSTQSGLRDKLKQATAAAHAGLDTEFSALDLNSPDDYRRFLETNAAALLPLEAALEEAGVARSFADWPERSRTAAIQADLDLLGGACRPLCRAGTFDRNGMLGAMYVLEGSRLGAKFLLRAVAGNPLIAPATSYLSHGAGKPLWRTFLLRLESEPVTPEDEAEIVRGAHLAFAMFAEAVRQA